jgi:hypothetical protein
MIPQALIKRLHELGEPVPTPLRLPTSVDVAAVEKQLGVAFHPDLRQYLLEASDVVLGALEPVTIGDPEAHTDMTSVCEGAWEDYHLPGDLMLICEDNGDFYCMNRAGQVVFWSHDGASDEKWSSLADWIGTVWIGGSESDEDDDDDDDDE